MRTLLVLTLVCAAAAAAAAAEARPGAGVVAPAPRDGQTVRIPDTTSAAHGSADTAAPARAAADTVAKKGQLADTVYYEAETINYDMQNKVIYLVNKAVARYQDVTLRADTITYRMDENLFLAVGSPRLEEKGDITVGDYLNYNISTRRGSVRYATTQTNGDYFTGRDIVKSEENSLYISEGDYTSCAYLDHPHYTFYGREIKIIPKDKAISRPVVFTIGEAPVAVFPYYIMPLERGRRSGILTPGWGGHPTSGGYLDNVGYYWAPNDYMDYLLAGKVREFSDFVATLRARYAVRYWLNGSIGASYHLGTNWDRNSQEWALSFAHDQNLLPDGSFTLRGSGNLASARVDNKTYYQSNSEIDNEIIQQNLTANMALEKRIEKLNTSVRLGWNRTQDLRTDKVVEDIPAIDFGLPSRPLIPPKTSLLPSADGKSSEPKWYNKIYYSYNVQGKVKRVAYLNDSLPGFTLPAASQSVSLSSPQTLFKWFTISPNFNTRLSSFYGYMKDDTVGWDTVRQVRRDTLPFAYPDSHLVDFRAPRIDTLFPSTFGDTSETTYVHTWYAQDLDSSARYDTVWDGLAHDWDWNAGVNLSTKLYGLFPIHIFNFAGMRHEFTPTISYTFSPRHEQDKRFFPVDIAAAPTRKESQRIGFSVGNLFQGKVVKPAGDSAKTPQARTFTMLTLNMGVSYDFEAPTHRWSDISLSAGTDLKLMRVGFNSAFWLYDQGDQGGRLTWPVLKNYSVSITPNNFSVGGRFWDGDLLVWNHVQPKDPVEYRNAGNQQWRLGLSPAFSYSSSRRSPDDFFSSSKNYQLTASASLGFTRHWGLNWSSTYDFVRAKFASHSLTFHCDMECWDLSFNWTPAGVQPGAYYFRINIKKIPDIKWEERK